jgi:hypothetical protein
LAGSFHLDARKEAESARARAHESAEALGSADQERPAADFKPSEELKSLYRQTARELHPDLTTDVEAVNLPIYDLRSQSRDAIIAGGSDAAGTRLAADELIRLLRENVKRPPPR